MSASLRDRVVEAVAQRLLTSDMYAVDELTAYAMAGDLTRAAFEEMSGARPCVTCGRGLGPAKVAKGYVQCYDCTRRGMMATDE